MRHRDAADRHRGERLNYVGEPAWAGRSAAELREAARHEALVNLAFANTHANILCPYDARALPAGVLADAERTHPVVSRGGKGLPSTAYLGSGRLPASCEEPLPPPPPGAAVLAYRTDLRPLRALAGRAAADAGLPDPRQRLDHRSAGRPAAPGGRPAWRAGALAGEPGL